LSLPFAVPSAIRNSCADPVAVPATAKQGAALPFAVQSAIRNPQSAIRNSYAVAFGSPLNGRRFHALIYVIGIPPPFPVPAVIL